MTVAPTTPAAPRARFERLQKVLAACGLGSRRHCEEYILAGRVAVDGNVIQKLGVRVDARSQKITVDGEQIRPKHHVYFMLNKPPGCLCTNRDPAGRPRVIDFFPAESARLFTVGRLDENSYGLLLVTNDGDLGNRLAHPRYQVQKVYRVQVAGNPTRETLDNLRKGLRFAQQTLRVQSVRRLNSKGKSVFLEIVLNEGQNRVIRRLLARVGHKVIDLQRVAYGPLKLGRLPLGKYRALSQPELKMLVGLVQNGDVSRQRGRSRSRSDRRRERTRNTPAARATRKVGRR